MTGVVHLVGAGPGDPELITVRGARLLAAADAVVHDRLVSPELLALARPGTLRIDAGKTGYGRSVPQATTSELLVRLARAGLTVVRLKGGDPFVFGRGGEEALALRAAGVPFTIVPGVTSGIAGPAYAGIPVTHRGRSRSVAFVTGSSARAEPVDFAALAAIDTLVVYMAGRTAHDVAAGLLNAGRPTDTPVVVVVDATLPSQEVRLTDLAAIAASGVPRSAGRPALLVVGEVVALAMELAWFVGSGPAAGTEPRSAVAHPPGGGRRRSGRETPVRMGEAVR